MMTWEMRFTKYSRTPIIRINWDGEPSGYAEIPDNWIFSLKIGYFGRLKWKQISTNGCFRPYIYSRANKTFKHNSFYVFDNRRKNLSHKNMQYNYSKIMFTRRAKPIWITNSRISGVLLYSVCAVIRIPG